MRRAWNHALSQARARRRRRRGVLFFGVFVFKWTLAVTFPVPYCKIACPADSEARGRPSALAQAMLLGYY
jgi:hypothetical protein